MAEIKDIIEINISRETRGVTRQGFGTPMFVSTHASFAERVRSYTNIAGITEDFAIGSSVYTAAVKMLSQQTAPTVIKIGRKDVSGLSGSVEVNDNTTYIMTINGSEFSFTSGDDTTAELIVAGLEAQVAVIDSVVFTDNLDGTFNITPEVGSESFVVKGISSNISVIYNSEESWVEAVDAVTAADDDYYFLTTETHSASDIEDISEYVEALNKLYFVSYSGDDALDSEVTTDIGSVLQSRNITRTILFFSRFANNEFPECAWVGLQAPKDPGSTTWKFKTLAGVTTDKLTANQSIVLRGEKGGSGKGYNTYESVGGRSITREGKVASGEFIDVMRTADWLEARMRERIYLTLVNADKIPYTNGGFAIIEGRMREVLVEGVAIGAFSDFQVTVPNPRNIDPNLRAERIASGFKFSARLAGAVHYVGIAGELTI